MGVPTGYFLEETIELGVNSILARLDAARQHEPYFLVNLRSSPPRAEHASWDYCDLSGRCVDALALAGQVLGRGWGDAEEALREFLLARANPRDGLFYNAESPWSSYAADMFCQGRVLLGLVSWYLLTGSSEVEAKIAALISGLSRIAVQRADHCFYPKDVWREGRWLEGGLWNGSAPGYAAQQLIGMVRYYEATGSREALALAGKLARHFAYHSGAIAWDGTFRGHTHSGGILPATLGVLRYALAVGDEELAGWCYRVYAHARRHTTAFGWIPDGLGLDPSSTPYAGTCETCALADLVELAIKLSQAGLGDHWDDVERFARNQLLENQIRDVERILPPTVPAEDRVRAMLRGSFDSAALPNALLGDPEGVLEGCCTPAGVRACCLVWDAVMSRDAEGVHVHLAVSRHTPWASLVSHEPHRGELRLRAHLPERYYLRLPEWADGRQVRLTVDGQPRAVARRGRYLDLGVAREGQTFVVTYPQPSGERVERIVGREYVVGWRGGTVTSISPAGARYPTYLRPEVGRGDEPPASAEPPAREAKVRW